MRTERFVGADFDVDVDVAEEGDDLPDVVLHFKTHGVTTVVAMTRKETDELFAVVMRALVLSMK